MSLSGLLLSLSWLVLGTSPCLCSLCCSHTCRTPSAVACTFWPQVFSIAGGIACM